MRSHFKKLIVLVQLGALLSQSAWAVKITDDDRLRVGKRSSSADKFIEFDLNQGTSNPTFKGDNTAKKLQFCQGGLCKDVGSGSGGGRNYADANPDAEGGTTGWVVYDDSATFATTDVNTGTDTITISGWAQPDGTPVSFVSGTTLPAGLSAATVYYTVNTSGTSFKVSTTLGGSAVDITSQGTGTHTLHPLVPIDGVGGSPTLTWTASATAPIRGTKSFLWTHGVTDQGGQGACYPFTIDRGDLGRSLSIRAEYEIASGTYVSSSTPVLPVMSDMQAYVIDVTAGTRIPVNGQTIPGAVVGLQMPYVGSFQTHISNTSYKFCLHQSLPNQNAYTAKFDSFSWGPDPKSIGVPVTPWASYSQLIKGSTADPAVGTGASQNCNWRRFGSSMEIMCSFTQTGGGTTGTGSYLLPIPSGNSIDSTVSQSTGLTFGTVGAASISYGSNQFTGYVKVYDSADLALVVGTTGTATNFWGSTTVPNMSTAGMTFSFHASIPIVGWSSNTAISSDVNTRPLNFRASHTQTVSTISTVAFASGEVTKDTHGAYNAATSKFVAPASAAYPISLIADVGLNSGNVGRLYYRINGGTDVLVAGTVIPAGGNSVIISGSDLLDLKQGDTVEARVSCSISSSVSVTMAIGSQGGGGQTATTDRSVARYSTAAGQSMPGSSATTIVNYDTKGWDNYGAVTTGASWKFTSNKAQKLKVCAFMFFATAAWTANNAVTVSLYKNGSSFADIFSAREWVSTTVSLGAGPGCTTVDMLQGDYFDVRVTNPESTARALETNAARNYISVESVD